MKYQDKARGMLVGLAVGDALGAPVEFLPAPANVYIKKMGDKIEHFHKNYRAPEGVWTDDTEMALCIADSLLDNSGYDSYDIMQRFMAWSWEGYRTYDGKPAVDIGGQTMRALEEFERHPVIFADDDKVESAGNGAIMRLAPIIIANTFPEKKYPTLQEAYTDGKLAAEPGDDGEFVDLKDIEPTIKMAVLSCRETHNSIAAETTTALFATTLYCALHGLPKQHIAMYCDRWFRGEEYEQFYLENSDSLVGRAYKSDEKQFYNLGGYVVDAFAISLWGLLHFDNFKDGMMAVIRLGGDTDTNAACYGQLAGAYYGYETIPEEWRKEVYLADELVEIADKLLAMPKCPILRTRFEDDEHFQEPENNYDLDRFLNAHEEYYSQALSEIKAGKKQSHWMWFIFPQLAELGFSETAKYYGIDGLAEAKAYLKNEILRAHLIEISNELYKQDDDIEYIFGHPDNLKLLSCMTLFSVAEPSIDIFEKIIDKFYSGKKDQKTLNIIGASL